jgi:hypothetical protein
MCLAVSQRNHDDLRDAGAVDADRTIGRRGLREARKRRRWKDVSVLVGGVRDVEHVVEADLRTRRCRESRLGHVRGCVGELPELGPERGLAVRAGVHGDGERNAGRGIHPEVRMVDARLRRCRGHPKAQGVPPGYAPGRQPAELTGVYVVQESGAELGRRQVSGARQPDVRVAAYGRFGRLVAPLRSAAGVVDQVRLPGHEQLVHAPLLRAPPPDPHPGALPEEAADVGEPIGDRELEVALRLDVPGVGVVAGRLDPRQQVARADVLVVCGELSHCERDAEQEDHTEGHDAPTVECGHISAAYVDLPSRLPR